MVEPPATCWSNRPLVTDRSNQKEVIPMRHQSALFMRKIGLCIGIALLLMGGARANAQLPFFDTIDWTMDRGAIGTVKVTQNGGTVAQNQGASRVGYNNFNALFPPAGPPDITSLLNNFPGRGERKWVFPRTSDLNTNGSITNTTTTSLVIVDNPTAVSDWKLTG